MTKAQGQIKTIATNLKTLAAKLEKLNAQVAAKPAPKKKAAAKKKAAPAKKRTVAAKKKAAPAKKKAVAKKTKAEAKNTVLDNVLDVVKKSKKGATIANLKAKTGLESRQLSNALYKLSKKKLIKTVSRGVYIKA
jgi:hypothetical protein